mgnify:CR=1 FL=1
MLLVGIRVAIAVWPWVNTVASPTNALDDFSGIYRDGRPGYAGLSGRMLYLFPDGRFILTEWADIVPERIVTAGDQRFAAGRWEAARDRLLLRIQEQRE